MEFTYLNQVSQYKEGQAYIIEQFATWCGPCRKMAPHMAELTKKYPNIFIVSVSDETEEEVKPFMAETPSTKLYNLALDSHGVAAKLSEEYQVQSIPHCYLFDANKKFVWHGHPASVEGEILKM